MYIIWRIKKITWNRLNHVKEKEKKIFMKLYSKWENYENFEQAFKCMQHIFFKMVT